MFYCESPQDIVPLLLYVNEMIIIGSDRAIIASLKQHLQRQFKMKDLGILCYFLGIEIDYFS